MVQLAGMVVTVNQISTEVGIVSLSHPTYLVNPIGKVTPATREHSAKTKP